MKVFKIVFISIFIFVAILFVAGIIFIKTFDVNRYKPRIIREVSKALARQVDFEKIALNISFTQGISLKISNFFISEDLAFGSGNFLAVKNISAGVDVLGYILRKKISITNIFIDSLKVTIIRQKDGSFNVGSIAKLSTAGKEIVKSSSAGTVLAMPAILVSSLESIKGVLTYIDYSFKPPLCLEARDLTLKVNKVSLIPPFSFSMDIAAKGILQDFIAGDKPLVKAEGIVNGKMNIQGSGFSPEALKSNLFGNVDLSVTKVKLKDINILRAVLNKITVIPELSEKVEDSLPESFKQKLIQKDTVLRDIKLPVIIKNSRFIVKEVFWGTDEFFFKGNGEVGLSGVYSFEGFFLIQQELSAAMVSGVSELRYLLNAEKQICIPLEIFGKTGEMRFKVDALYIARKLLVNQVQEQFFKIFKKNCNASVNGGQ